MRPMNMKNATSKTQLFLALVVAVTLHAQAAFAAVPGITGTSAAGTSAAAAFSLTAQDAYLNQPDGEAVYSWGYGCVSQPPAAAFVPAVAFAFTPSCNTMQVPGPTLVVNEGATVMVSLINQLPTAAGNTSILFPGFNVSTSCTAQTPVGQQGLLTCEAAPGSSVAPGSSGAPGSSVPSAADNWTEPDNWAAADNWGPAGRSAAVAQPPTWIDPAALAPRMPKEIS